MIQLRIEHAVPDYEAWKQVFDADPVGREHSGVRRYRILRAADEPNHVMIDLDFDTAEQAEALLAAMRVVWGEVQGTLIAGPNALIADMVESVEY